MHYITVYSLALLRSLHHCLLLLNLTPEPMDSLKGAADKANEAIDYGWKEASSALVKAVKVTGEQADAAKERMEVRKIVLRKGFTHMI